MFTQYAQRRAGTSRRAFPLLGIRSIQVSSLSHPLFSPGPGPLTMAGDIFSPALRWRDQIHRGCIRTQQVSSRCCSPANPPESHCRLLSSCEASSVFGLTLNLPSSGQSSSGQSRKRTNHLLLCHSLLPSRNHTFLGPSDPPAQLRFRTPP